MHKAISRLRIGAFGQKKTCVLRTYMCVCVCVCVRVCVCVCVYLYIYKHIYIHTHMFYPFVNVGLIYTCIYMCMYMLHKNTYIFRYLYVTT